MLNAMISSTAIDLPEHRKQVIDACLREGIFPIGMEYLVARDRTSIEVSMEMVDNADIYIGIYAWRYGWVPDGNDISITEMEFNYALERKRLGRLKDILIFVMHDDHPIKASDVEADTVAQDKLKRLKERASAGRVRATFKSPQELRSLVVHSLADSKRRVDLASAVIDEPTLHPPNCISIAPKPYIAHPYSLLQTKEVIGRQTELNVLTDWVTTSKHIPASTHLLALIALGGMGKSALAWKWFNDIVPKELPAIEGSMWWSFYESDAHFENFVIRTLAYTADMPEAEVRRIEPAARDETLLRHIDERPFLLVLDGLERVLVAYSGIDAAHMHEGDLDENTADTEAQGLSASPANSHEVKHRLRRCADPRAGRFLQRLAGVRATHVLISSRLYPAELETQTGQPIPGCLPMFIAGLDDDDALSLWRAFGVSGTREQLLSIFHAFGNYPLLLRALAGEVAGFRPAPGNFSQWRAANPDFNPAGLALTNAKTHVLEFALRGLSEPQRCVLHTIAAFRMPATWETLKSVVIGISPPPVLDTAIPSEDEGFEESRTRIYNPWLDDFNLARGSSSKGRVATNLLAPKPCSDERELDVVLTELEDRGLVGWDRNANRYDLHPIVRSIVWKALSARGKVDIYDELTSYFEAVHKPKWHGVESVDQLAPAIELFSALIGLDRFDDACAVFLEHIDTATHDRLSASRLRIQLLSSLVESTGDGACRLNDPSNVVAALNGLGKAYTYAGEPGTANSYHLDSVALSEESPVLNGPYPWCLCDLSNSLRPSGHLYEAIAAGLRAVALWRQRQAGYDEIRSLVRLGLALAATSRPEALIVLHRALVIARRLRQIQSEGFVSSGLAQCSLWSGSFQSAYEYGKRAWTWAHDLSFERDFVRAARLQGVAALELGDLRTAFENLNMALERARKVDFVEEELLTLAGLAEGHRRLGEIDEARARLDEIWVPAERGPYPLIHADARNILARIERDVLNCSAAISAANQAYELAWCDGPPYAYQYGLQIAKQLITELNASEPQLRTFDERAFEPMPDLELNPSDEFKVDAAMLNLNG